MMFNIALTAPAATDLAGVEIRLVDGAGALVGNVATTGSDGNVAIEETTPDGPYVISVGSPPTGTAWDGSQLRAFNVVAVNGTSEMAATFTLVAAEGQHEDEEPAEDSPERPGEAKSVNTWGPVELVIGMAIGIGYWVIMLALPTQDADGFGDVGKYILGLSGGAIAIGGAYLCIFWKTGSVLKSFGAWREKRAANKAAREVAGARVDPAEPFASMSSQTDDRPTMLKRFALGLPLIVLGLTLAMMSQFATNPIDLSSGRRLGLAVGGVAIGGLLVGLTRFDTIRAAASLVIVILFIGLVTFPEARELIDEDITKWLIVWMGAILGVNTIAEATNQVAQQNAEATVAKAQVEAGADEATVSRQSLHNVPGDLRR